MCSVRLRTNFNDTINAHSHTTFFHLGTIFEPLNSGNAPMSYHQVCNIVFFTSYKRTSYHVNNVMIQRHTLKKYKKLEKKLANQRNQR